MLPVYARMADEEVGLLKQFCEAGLQPELDKLRDLLAQQEYLYDPEHPASWQHLDWLGQFFGLGIIEGHWLGVGINPLWPTSYKIDLIQNCSNYWQTKGTPAGMRNAIALWLRFNDPQKLVLQLPFGRNSLEGRAHWWEYGTPYDDHLNKTYAERRHLAWGNYWGQLHHPNYYSLYSETWKWDYCEPWSDLLLDVQPSPEVIDDRSRLGDQEIWMHFYLSELEWNRIFPNIFELNTEILPIPLTATVFGWLSPLRRNLAVVLPELPPDETTIISFELDGCQWGQVVKPPANNDGFVYGGTILPCTVVLPYERVEEHSTVVTGGIWEPQFWDGDWWCSLILKATRVETLSITNDLSAIAITFIASPVELTISTYGLDQVGLSAGGFWYLAYGDYVEVSLVTVQDPGVPCSLGVPFTNDAKQLSFTWDYDPGAITNQLLSFEDQEFELAIPTNIADHFNLWSYEPSYFYLKKNAPWGQTYYSAMETFSANSLYTVTTLAIDPRRLAGYLCNVNAYYSDFTPTNISVSTLVETPDPISVYPILGVASDAKNWHVMVAVDEEIYILSPTTMFWHQPNNTKARSQEFSFDKKFTTLYLEFLFKPKTTTHVQSVTLSLLSDVVDCQSFYYNLNAINKSIMGLAFEIPLVLPTGVDTPTEELLLQQLLPELNQAILDMAGVNLPMSALSEQARQMLVLQPLFEAESIKDILVSLRNLIKTRTGDKHFPYTITIPSLNVTIVHNLNKYPSVSFVDTVTGTGTLSEGNVEYIDLNTIKISFSDFTTGRVFCN